MKRASRSGASAMLRLLAMLTPALDWALASALTGALLLGGCEQRERTTDAGPEPRVEQPVASTPKGSSSAAAKPPPTPSDSVASPAPSSLAPATPSAAPAPRWSGTPDLSDDLLLAPGLRTAAPRSSARPVLPPGPIVAPRRGQAPQGTDEPDAS